MTGPSWRRIITKAALLAALAVASVSVVVASPATRSVASTGTVSFSTTPALYPDFSPSVTDYVVRCTAGTPVQVAVSNSDGTDTTTTVSVDGQPPQTGAFVAPVTLGLGQEFSVAVNDGATAQQYFVRCLPAGFPSWTSERTGTPQAEYYVVAPSLANGASNHYLTIYDTDGVPIWWFLPPNGDKAIDPKIAPDGDVLWTETNTNLTAVGAEERRLDGTVVDDTIAPVGYDPDFHEVQLLPNGDYLVMGHGVLCCYDLSGYGGSASATILDTVIQQVTPGGAALWTWKASDHIGMDEVVPQWWPTILAGASQGFPYDVFHMNSIEADAAGNLLVSFRYEGVYKVIDPTAPTDAGKIVWKLGGSPSTMAPGTHLTIIGDPIFAAGGDFGGQHYARYYDAGDGNVYVTVHDNGSLNDRPPRGVRYRIDATAMTATLVEDVRDNADPDFRSICCGSARELPAGDWVMSWGYGNNVMELTPAGDRVFLLTLDQPSYRADPVLPGVLSRAALRAGMDAQYQQATLDTDADGCPDVREPLLVPPTDPQNPWDFYSVPAPALFAAPDPTHDVRGSVITASGAEAVFAYFKQGAVSGTTLYDQDLDGNGVADGVQYDRTVVGPGQSGPPDGVITASEAQVAFAQFRHGYTC